MMAGLWPGYCGCLQTALTLITLCGLHLTDGNRQSQNRPTSSFYRCLQVPHYQSDSSDDKGLFMVVAKCPANSKGNLKDRCESEPEDLLEIIPVTDTTADVTYRNVFCAYCHGQLKIIRWQLKLKCPRALKQGDTGFGFVLPAISACSNLEIYQPSDRVPLSALQTCARADLASNPGKRAAAVATLTNSAPEPRLGYAALFNFGFDGQANLLFTDDATSARVCSDPDQLYNPFELKCMRIRCPNDYMSVNGECVPRAVALGRIVQSQTVDSNYTDDNGRGGSTDRRSICMDVRLPVAAARQLAKSSERFEDDFRRLHVVQAFHGTRMNRVNVSLLTPVLSELGHCKVSARAADPAELSSNYSRSATKQQPQLLDTNEEIEMEPTASSGQNIDPAGAISEDRYSPVAAQTVAGGSSRIEERRSARSAMERSSQSVAGSPALGGPRELTSASNGEKNPPADTGRTWNQRGYRRKRSSSQGNSDDPLLVMSQDQVCNATSVQPGHAECDGEMDCIVSMKVNFRLFHRKQIFDFVKKSWKTSFEYLLTSSNTSDSVCIEGVVHDDEASWCAGMTLDYFNQEFELLWSNETEIIGVRVPGADKSYTVGKFQFIVDLDKTYWADKNISQMAVVCDPMPRIVDTNCSRFSLQAKHFELLPNQSIRATYLSQDPVFRTLPSYKELYTTDEYEYIRGEYNTSNDNSTGSNEGHLDESYVLQTCAPLQLISEYVQMLANEQPSQNGPCSFLDDFASASSIVGLVCTLVSLVAMTITFLTYVMFRSLRTLAGISIMNLTVVEFAAQLTFLLGSYVGAAQDPCTALAVLSHYFLLCSFFWTNVMAYIGYKSFGSRLRVRLVQRPSDAKPLLHYASYAYGVPAVICAVCIGVNFGVSQNLIGYGGITSTDSVPVSINGTLESVSIVHRGMGCWIDNPMATLLSFGAPLVYCLLVNVILFVRTVYGMRSYQKGSTCRRSSSGVSEGKSAQAASPKDDAKRGVMLRRDSGINGRRRDPSQLSIQVRLSVLYGFSWVFGIVIAVVGTHRTAEAEPGKTACYVVYILSLFFNLLNGSMGTFIFFAFTFNQRILYLYKSRFTRQPQSPTFYTSQTQRHSSSQLTIVSLLVSQGDLANIAK